MNEKERNRTAPVKNVPDNTGKNGQGNFFPARQHASVQEQQADHIAEQVVNASAKAATLPVIQKKGTGEQAEIQEYGLQSAISGGQYLPDTVRSYYEPRMGFDFSNVKIHTGENAAASAQSLHAQAYTVGRNIVFNKDRYAPDTHTGKKLLAHELTHVMQQHGQAGSVQKKEDWDFTPKDYETLTKAKGDLTFGADSGWVPQKLKDNILATLKFVLTSKPVERTRGINVKDFYHGHLAVPKAAMTEELRKSRSQFSSDSDALEAKGRGGESYDKITNKNLKTFSEAMVKIENLATPLVDKALAVKGCTVIYHTFELSGPAGMKAGSDVRNIKTDIDGSPAGFSPPDINNASSYTDNFAPILQFAFLVDEKGVIHITVGTTSNLSRVTGTPLE